MLYWNWELLPGMCFLLTSSIFVDSTGKYPQVIARLDPFLGTWKAISVLPVFTIRHAILSFFVLQNYLCRHSLDSLGIVFLLDTVTFYPEFSVWTFKGSLLRQFSRVWPCQRSCLSSLVRQGKKLYAFIQGKDRSLRSIRWFFMRWTRCLCYFYT